MSECAAEPVTGEIASEPEGADSAALIEQAAQETAEASSNGYKMPAERTVERGGITYQQDTSRISDKTVARYRGDLTDNVASEDQPRTYTTKHGTEAQDIYAGNGARHPCCASWRGSLRLDAVTGSGSRSGDGASSGSLGNSPVTGSTASLVSLSIWTVTGSGSAPLWRSNSASTTCRSALAMTPMRWKSLWAEIGAAFLCADIGITAESRPDHAAYIDHWLRIMKGDKKAIFAAASAATTASTFLASLQSAAAGPNTVAAE